MSVFNLHQGLLAGASAGGGAVFDSTLIGNSIWLEGAGTSGDAMTRTWGTESNQDRWIWATWYQPLRAIDAVSKRNNLFASGSASHGFYLNHTSTSSTFNIFHRDNAGTEGAINTTESYRDTTSWIHVLLDYDSANANAEDRISLYVNGVRTGVNSGNRPGQNNNINTNVSGQTARIGQDLSTTPNYHVQGYLAQTIFLDNKSIANGDLAISNFLDTFTLGTNGSQIIPKADADIIALASAAGNNSFCLDYSDASNIVNDASTKTNHFTAVSSSITSANQSLHSPSKVYATWNALDSALTGHNTDMTLSDGGTVTEDGNGAFCRSTFAIPEGLFSYRVTVDDSTSNQMFGVALDTALDRGNGNTNHPGQYAVNAGGGDKNTNGTGTSQYSAWSDGDTMEVYVSRSGTTYKVWYGKNGTLLNGASGSQGDPSAGTNELFSFTHTGDVFFSADYTNPGTKKATTDFGQKGYSPAEDALTLSSPNIPAPRYQGIDYFDSTLYEGNGTGQRVGDFMPVADLYTVSKSALFNDDDTRILSKTFGGSGDRRTMTFSTWAKWTNPAGSGQIIFSSGTSLSDRFEIEFASADNITIFSKVSNSTILNLGSTISVADTTQWVNIVVSIDTDQASTAERFRLFVNGVQQTLAVTTDSLTSGDGSADSGDQLHLNSAIQHNIGGRDGGLSAAYFDGYLAETVFIDGARLDASSFGQVDTSTNRWVPKSVSGLTFGTNGFYLEYKVATGTGNGVGTDSAGSNHFAQEGTWTTRDQVSDSPSENFAIIDSDLGADGSGGALTEGNMVFRQATTAGNHVHQYSSLTMESGKYYAEYAMVTQATNRPQMSIGVLKDPDAETSGLSSNIPTQTNGFGHGQYDANNDGASGSTLSSLSLNNNIFGILLDLDNLNVKFSINGTINNNLTIDPIPKGKYRFASSTERGSGDGEHRILVNYGQLIGGFEAVSNFTAASTSFDATTDAYWVDAPPAGYVALREDNLNATSSKITAWAWIKNRDADDNHVLVDRVRGVGKVWESNTNTAAFTNANTVQTFVQRGVQVGNDVQVNTSNEKYVLWQWLVGGSATTGSTTSPAGTIASTTIVAVPGHFSVGTYTGTGADNATIGHGLGGIPEMIIVRNLSRTTFGLVWHTDGGGATHTADFAVTATFSANSQKFGGSDASNPTADVFKIGTHNEINANTESFVFYAFRSIPGVCKVGSYEGNNSADGTYVSLGFTPALVITKTIDATGAWGIYDNKRDPDNPVQQRLFANANSSEGTDGEQMDFLSDGFKLRKTGGHNNNNETYIYLAMADIAGNGTLPPIYGK